MGITKAAEFSVVDNQLAQLAKALAHPARIAILKILLKRDTCICGDIVDVLPLSQSTVSQHLKELKTAGLIQGDIEGTKVCYCINEKTWAEAKEVFGKLFRQDPAPRSGCC